MAGYGEIYGGTFRTNYANTDQTPRSSEYATKSGAITGISGAATGAMAGTYVMPGLGTAIGAIIGGAVGYIAGAFGGSAKAKSKRYQKLAAQVQQQREANKDYAYFLQFIRQQRLARAATLAQSVASGTEMTSKTAGAVSGQQAQTGFNLNYLAEDRRLQTIYASYMQMAGKAASISNDIYAGFDAGSAMALAVANMYGQTNKNTTKPDTNTTELTAMDRAALKTKPEVPFEYYQTGSYGIPTV